MPDSYVTSAETQGAELGSILGDVSLGKTSESGSIGERIPR